MRNIADHQNKNQISEVNNEYKRDKYSFDEFHEKIRKLENEREQARFYAKELEQELQQTKNDLSQNQVNLIEPLKARLADLEGLIQEKELKAKRNYKRKLRRCKKELENEKKINNSLVKRISLFNPNDRSISEVDINEDSNSGLKYVNK